MSLNKKKLSWPQAAYPHPHTGPGFTSLHPVSSHTSVEVGVYVGLSRGAAGVQGLWKLAGFLWYPL